MQKESTQIGKYASLNSFDKGSSIIVIGNNLQAITLGSSSVRSTIGKSSGKWFWEVTKLDTPVGGSIGVGYGNFSLLNYVGFDINGWEYDCDGKIYNNNIGVAYGATRAVNNVVGIALDMDLGNVTFYKNGVSQGLLVLGLSGIVYAAVGGAAAGNKFLANFGNSLFVYPVPVGFNSGLY